MVRKGAKQKTLKISHDVSLIMDFIYGSCPSYYYRLAIKKAPNVGIQLLGALNKKLVNDKLPFNLIFKVAQSPYILST